MRRQLPFLCRSAVLLYALPAMAMDVDVHMGADGPSADIPSSAKPTPPPGVEGHRPAPLNCGRFS